jgi:hypothetical protein
MRIKSGDIVQFRPLTGDEIYMRQMPAIGSVGSVIKVSIDSSLFILWGIVMPTAEVTIDKIDYIIYTEDLICINQSDTGSVDMNIV